jgi:hypothetical protein
MLCLPPTVGVVPGTEIPVSQRTGVPITHLCAEPPWRDQALAIVGLLNPMLPGSACVTPDFGLGLIRGASFLPTRSMETGIFTDPI